MGFCAAVKEKLPEEFDPCFRSDQCINHQDEFELMSNKFTRFFRNSKEKLRNVRKNCAGRIVVREEGLGIREQGLDKEGYYYED